MFKQVFDEHAHANEEEPMAWYEGDGGLIERTHDLCNLFELTKIRQSDIKNIFLAFGTCMAEIQNHPQYSGIFAVSEIEVNQHDVSLNAVTKVKLHFVPILQQMLELIEKISLHVKNKPDLKKFYKASAGRTEISELFIWVLLMHSYQMLTDYSVRFAFYVSKYNEYMINNEQFNKQITSRLLSDAYLVLLDVYWDFERHEYATKQTLRSESRSSTRVHASKRDLLPAYYQGRNKVANEYLESTEKTPLLDPGRATATHNTNKNTRSSLGYKE